MLLMSAALQLPQTSRRHFIAGTLAALPLMSVADQPQRKEGMTLGFSTYGMKKLRTEEALKEIIRIGYDAVEITVWPGWDAAPGNMSAARRKQVRSQISNGGLELSSLMEHVTPGKSVRDRAANLKRLNGVFELAADLAESPPLVQTVLGGGKFEAEKNRIRDCVGAWAEAASQQGVTLAIKPHRGGVVSQPSEGVWIIEQLDKPENLKLVYDYSHYIYRDLSLSETVATAMPYIAHVAVKDAAKQGDRVVFQLPGTAGTIPFDALLRRLDAGECHGDISCEVSGMVWNKAGYDPVKAAETCYRNVSAAFEQAGVTRR